LQTLRKNALKCDICGRESFDWKSFVFRWERDWDKKELRGFSIRCHNQKCFPQIASDSIIEGWNHAWYFLYPTNLIDLLLNYLGVLLEDGFKIQRPDKDGLERFLAICSEEIAMEIGSHGTKWQERLLEEGTYALIVAVAGDGTKVYRPVNGKSLRGTVEEILKEYPDARFRLFSHDYDWSVFEGLVPRERVY